MDNQDEKYQKFLQEAGKILDDLVENNPDFKKFCEEKNKIDKQRIEELIAKGHSEIEAYKIVYSPSKNQ